MGQGILEFLEFRHCEALKKPKQSHQIAVIASEAKQSHLEFPQIRHCEALKKAEAISLGHRHCEALKKPKQSHLLSLGILN